MAKPRRAERERNSGNDSAEHVESAGNGSSAEGSEQQQPNLPDADRNITVVEPESAKQPESNPGPASSNNSGRSRARASASSRKSTPVRISPEKSKEGLAVLLTGIHAMGAKLVHECLALDKKEAEQLSEAIFTVNELYDGGFISPKAAAWGNLIMCAGTIYGPRAMVMLFKKKLAAQQKELTQNENN